MFRGLKDKLGKGFNQASNKLSARSFNQENTNQSTTVKDEKTQETVTPTNSLIDLTDDASSSCEYDHHQAHQPQFSTPINTNDSNLIDHKSPAVLDLSNYESNEDLSQNENISSANTSSYSNVTPRKPSVEKTGVAGSRTRNDSMNSQTSDSYYFSPNSNLVSTTQQQQQQFNPHHSLTSDAESVASELEETNSNSGNGVAATNKMLEFISKEELLMFYRKIQAKNHKYSGRYSQLYTAYKDLEGERDRLKEVLTKCQDKAFQRINELKEQISLKNMAMNDVEVNYTMMLQEKEEFIKVLQMQVNILKKKFEENKDRLIDVDNDNDGNNSNNNKKESQSIAIDINEYNALKEKNNKMTALLGNCKATILKHREEIKELTEENKLLKENSAVVVEKSVMNKNLPSSTENELASRIKELETQLELTLLNNKQLYNDYTALQADNVALTHNFNETKDIMNEDLRLLVEQKTDLESKFENLHEENTMLKKKIEKLNVELDSGRNGGGKDEDEGRIKYLEKLLKQHEESISRWKDKIISSIDYFSSSNDYIYSHGFNGMAALPSSSPSLTAAIQNNVRLAEKPADAPTLSSSLHPLDNSTALVDSGLESDFKEIFKKIESNLIKVLDSKKKYSSNEVQTENIKEIIIIDAADPKKKLLMQENLDVDNRNNSPHPHHHHHHQNHDSNDDIIRKLKSEKRELKKSLSRSRNQTKIFKHLCKTIFNTVQGVAEGGNKNDDLPVGYVDDGAKNNISGNGVEASEGCIVQDKTLSQQEQQQQQQALLEKQEEVIVPALGETSGDQNLLLDTNFDQNCNEKMNSSVSSFTITQKQHKKKCLKDDNSDDYDKGRDWFSHASQGFEPSQTIRQSIIAILKDGLSRALVKMEENKKKNQLQKSTFSNSDIYSNQTSDCQKSDFVDSSSLLADTNSQSYPTIDSSSFISESNSVKSQEFQEVYSTTDERMVKRKMTKKNNDDDCDDNDDEDDQWESVDEECDDDDIGVDDGDVGGANRNFTEDRKNENQTLGNVRINRNLKDLLISWKTSCEKVELSGSTLLDHVVYQQINRGNDKKDKDVVVLGDNKQEQHVEIIVPVKSKVALVSHDRVNEEGDLNNGVSISELQKQFSELESELKTCRHDRDILSENLKKITDDYSIIKSDVERYTSYLEEKKQENDRLIETIEDLRKSLESGNYDKNFLRDERDKIKQELSLIIEEKDNLQGELRNMTEHCEQLQDDYNRVNERLEKNLDDFRKFEMDSNVLTNVHNDLKDEHEKLIAHSNELEVNFNKIKENLSKLQQEKEHLADDYKSLQLEVGDLRDAGFKQNERFEDLKVEYNNTIAEVEKVKFENLELLKLHEVSINDFNKLNQSHEMLQTDYENITKNYEELKKDNSNLKEINDNLTKVENDLKLKITELERSNEGLIDKYKDDNELNQLLKCKVEECNHLKEDLSTLRENYDQIQIEMEMIKSRYQKSLDDNDTLEERCHKLLEERDVSLSKIDKLEAEICDKNLEIEKVASVKEELFIKNADKENELEKLVKFKIDSESLENELKTKNDNLKSELINLKNMLEEKDLKITESNETIERLMEEIKISDGEMNKYKSELKEMHRILESSSHELSEKSGNLEKEITKLMNELIEEKRQKDGLIIQLENFGKENKENFKKHEELLANEIVLRSQLAELKQELHTKSELCENLKNQICEQTEIHESIMNNSRMEISELKFKIESLKLDEADKMNLVLAKCEQDKLDICNKLKKEIEKLEIENESFQKDIKIKNLTIEELNVKLSQQEDNINKLRAELKNNEECLQNDKKDNHQLISKLSDEIESLKLMLSQKDESISSLNKEFMEKIEELKKNEVCLKEKLEMSNQEKLKSNHSLIESYENILTDLNKEVQEKDSKISSLIQEIADKDITLGSYRIQLDEKDIKVSCLALEFDNLKEDLTRQKMELKDWQEREEVIKDLNLKNVQFNEQLNEKCEKLQAVQTENYNLTIDLRNKDCDIDNKLTEIKRLQEDIQGLTVKLAEKDDQLVKLNDQLKSSEQDWSERMNELKRKAEIKMKQLKKQKSDADEKVVELNESLKVAYDDISLFAAKLAKLDGQFSLKEENSFDELDENIRVNNILLNKECQQDGNKEKSEKRSITIADGDGESVKELLREKLSFLQTNLVTLSEKSAKFVSDVTSLRQDVDGKCREIEVFKEKSSEFEQKIIELNTEIVRKNEDFKAVNDELIKCKTDLDTSNELLKVKEAALLNKSEVITTLESNMAELNVSIVSLNEELSRRSQENFNLKENLEKYSRDSFNDHNTELEKLKIELKELMKEKEISENEISTLKQEKKDLLQKLETASLKSSEDILNLEAKNQSTLETLERLRSENSSLKENVTKLSEELNRMQELAKTDGKGELENSSEKLESLQKELSEVTEDRDALKRKVQTLQQEVKKLKCQCESNLKDAEQDKIDEINRLKQEYTDEMKERDEDNDSRVKLLLKEFQNKMDDKEREYQVNFTKSLEKFELEAQDRLNEVQDEIKELKEELRMKDEQIDELGSQIDDLKHIMNGMHSSDEWKILKERENELEVEIQMLNEQLNHYHKQDDSSEIENEIVKSKSYTLALGNQTSSLSSSSSLLLNQMVPLEFEYLKSVLFKFMTSAPDKQTLARVICKIMKYSDDEEKDILVANKR